MGMDVDIHEGYVVSFKALTAYLKGLAEKETSPKQLDSVKSRSKRQVVGSIGEEKELAKVLAALNKLKGENKRRLMSAVAQSILHELGVPEDYFCEDIFDVFLTCRTHGSELGYGEWFITFKTEEGADYGQWSSVFKKVMTAIGGTYERWTEVSY